MGPVSPDPWLTRKEVRFRLRQMSRTTLWRRQKKGLRFNREGLIRASELEVWLASGTDALQATSTD